MRRRIAVALIVCAVASNSAGCSQPIDTGSQVPARDQPIVALLALVGVGVALTALHHHNEHRHNGAPSAPSLTSPILVAGLGNQPFDIALDQSLTSGAGVGALGTVGGGGRFGFVEVLSPGTNNGSYALPSGYVPSALAIDGSGNAWFVDRVGAIKKCPPPSSTVTVCTPSLSFSDGLLSSGIRSIAADGTHVFIALDNQLDTVFWVAFMLDGTSRVAGSYVYSPGLGTFSNDAVVATTVSLGISTYIIFHKDGASRTVTLPGPASVNPFKFNPPPAPTENIAADLAQNFYGFLGSATGGEYQLGHFVGVGNPLGAPGTLVARSTIAFNGQTNPNSGLFTVPLAAARSDGFDIFTLDSSGNLVVFPTF